MNNNPVEARFHFVNPPGLALRAELDVKLHHERGVIEAVFDSDDSSKLRVVYEPDHFSEETLLDWLIYHFGTKEIVVAPQGALTSSI